MRQPEPPAHVALSTRDDWVALARQLVEPALEQQSPGLSEIRLPGRASWHGERADGLEGFARVLLLEALAGCREPVVGASASRFLDGIAVGVGESEDRWIRASENRHALVEAVSIALSLWVGDHRLWHALTRPTQLAVARWLTECVDLHPSLRNNWVLFAFTINRFLASVGLPHPERAQVESLSRARLDELYRGGGWYSDDGPATFDFYNSFAYHFYPGLVAYLDDDRELLEQSAARLTAFLPSLDALIGPDGAPVHFGRSMTYRWAVATPLSAAPLLGITDSRFATPGGTARVIEHFVALRVIVPGKPLLPGWGPEDTDVVQHYSGPGAAYWAGQAFVNLLLPREHPYWQPASEAARPRTPDLYLPGPGLLVTAVGSVVRLANHGSYDTNATDIQGRTDDPFYARLAYSSITLPLVGLEADNAVTVSSGGRRFRRGRIAATGGGTGWAASDGWLRDLESGAELEHPARFCTVTMGSWDIHLFALPPEEDLADATVSITGWPSAALPNSDVGGTVAGQTITLTSGIGVFELHGMLGFTSARVLRGSRPAGRWALGELTGDTPNQTYAAASSLRRNEDAPAGPPPTIRSQSSSQWCLRSPGYGDRIVTLGASGFSVLDGSAS